MAKRLGEFVIFWLVLGVMLILPHGGLSASLPKSIQEMLTKLKLNPSILGDIDRELKVPKDWLDQARKDGKLRIITTGGGARGMKITLPLFKERYPSIDIDYSAGSQETRVIKPLVAYRAGRVFADVLFSVSAGLSAFKELNALEDLRSIPGWKNVPEKAKEPDGLWVGRELLYYCIGYNTRLVKKEELPKKWEDLLTNPIWRGGNLGLGNRPQLWALHLWKAKGERWTKEYLTKLFSKVKPQLRKEGISALPELLAAGEFHAVIPAGATQVYEKILVGAPLGFKCLEPIPINVPDIVILRGTPNLHAARVFVNWRLSKEGQIAEYFARGSTPVHKDLKQSSFFPFGEEILGKKKSYRDSVFEHEVLPKLTQFWNKLWLGGIRIR